MRILTTLAVTAAIFSTVSTLSFLSSGSSSGSNWLTGLQNSSFGQFVSSGVNTYNTYKNNTPAVSTGTGTPASSSGSGQNWLSGLQNSSFGQFVNNGVDMYNQYKNNNNSVPTSMQQQLANSSFGEVIQSGMNWYNNKKNQGTDMWTQFVPFLANASSEAKTEFYAILPNVGNMTVNEFEAAVNTWAAKHGLTEEVNAFNERAKNMTKYAEDRAQSTVSQLPNVLNNLKTITNNKNQTVTQMHNAVMSYVMTLDEDTREIVFVLFSSMLPPEFKSSKCGMSGIATMFNDASQFFSGQGKNGNTSLSNHPHFGMVQGFLQQNNQSNFDFGTISAGFQNFFNGGNKNGDGKVLGGEDMMAIQIMPMESDIVYEEEITATTKKLTKKQQQSLKKAAEKAKKNATTVKPSAAAKIAVL